MENKFPYNFAWPEEIYSHDGAGAYWWDEFHVYVRYFGSPEWKYYFDDDSGCSCNSYETPDWPDINCWYTYAQVVKGFLDWSCVLPPMEKVAQLERLLKTMQEVEANYTKRRMTIEEA